ncbi:hypothetical protein DICPUDRAFT_53050 [Dictyostelium purpureum]|uniref:TPR repeat-containing protein n=1 Tax=Dictyostelium purpureum TaxID=5786 RepID=F0ZAY2_DICPU|nr:uncharacterized protein DICPUDRAFT_53050 [Dictyostelium purpureum]EGC38879.1 hypothetical protein DICPUDRAFT_53050 [Dictyostelium purpureum]|eukprot:XP_003284559.1 hypothetical protein DICPUDRAFT_53050 [Dictyostelium purpureum]
MAPPKPNRAKQNQINKKKKFQESAAKKQVTAEQYIEEGEKHAATYHFDKALECFKNALILEPENTLVMDTIGEILLESGDLEQAKSYFYKSIQVNSDDSATKYMNLGQLVGGDDALKCYNKGVEIMERELKKLIALTPTGEEQNKVPKPLKPQQLDDDNDEEKMDDEEEEEEEEEESPIAIIKAQLCSALCSKAELYLTDQCFDDDAETQCETSLLKAIEYSPYSPEPYSLMASMKISQVKNTDAIQYLNKSYSLWETSDIDDRPEFDYRYNIALLFIELKQNRTAVDILEQLVNEQDNIAEVWYTLGVVYNSLDEPLSAQDCLSTAKDLLKITKIKDRELEKLVSDLLKKVEKDVSLLPPEELNQFNDDDDEDNQVVAEDEEDEEMNSNI